MPVSTPSSGARGVVSTFTLRALAVPFQAQVGEGAADIDRQTCLFPFSVLCRRLLDVAAEIGLADARIGAHLGRRAFHE